jgi:hypothetical protein
MRDYHSSFSDEGVGRLLHYMINGPPIRGASFLVLLARTSASICRMLLEMETHAGVRMLADMMAVQPAQSYMKSMSCRASLPAHSLSNV